ncbi:MAG: MFS transporter [Saprospiraceae bacterium]|nr:MFS transporter [Saprospiraceae bacterium]HMW39691.1 MFS transporter [Saprospiraceae bacterium]HMX88834.1 MFS transporter [Saprospiraceae bacterium]HMZ39302.1 MFS transporter [Saprospiraceae bacterium]HNA65450.1 MFS transporter [Saprospiraceae bacterium]
MTQDKKSALAYPNFTKLIGMNFFLTLSLMMQEVLVSYELYRVTRDPMSLGLIGIAVAIPYISVTLLGGHYADRSRKKRIMLFAIGCMMLAGILFVIIFMPRNEHFFTLPNKILLIYVFFGLSGLARGFYQPAASSLRPLLIPRSLYGNGSTWNSTAWQLGSISGSLVAGFAYAGLGLQASLLISLLMMALAMGLLAGISVFEKTYNVNELVKENILLSIREGFGFVLRNKILLYSITLDLVAVLFAGVVAILPIFAQDILQVGAQGLGYLRAAPSIGASLGLLLMTKYSPMKNAWRNMIIAVAGFGLATVIFGLSDNFILSLLMLFFTGAFDSISVVIRGTLLQLIPPDHLRGRVLAVNNIFVSSSNELGAFESGLAARLLGTVPSVLAGGAVTLGAILLTWINTKELLKRRFD